VNDTHVTVVGTVVNSPRRNQVGDTYVTNFRIGSNARRYDSAREGWATSGSFYADVECWGELGGNVVRSIAKGHAVVVTGTLTTREWETENGRGSTSRIRAEAVGPNLRWTWAEVKQQERATPSADGAPNGASSPSVDQPGAGLIRGRDYQGIDDALDEENSESEPQPVHA
jgi:single-strand DNA-binding protein